MNKKILFLILAAIILVLPSAILAAEIPAMITNIETAAKTIGTSIVIIGWIIAGILYLTAAGNPEQTKAAHTAMVAAVIGTVLIVLAGAIQAAIKTLLGV